MTARLGATGLGDRRTRRWINERVRFSLPQRVQANEAISVTLYRECGDEDTEFNPAKVAQKNRPIFIPDIPQGLALSPYDREPVDSWLGTVF